MYKGISKWKNRTLEKHRLNLQFTFTVVPKIAST
jgi:hypothetical protein